MTSIDRSVIADLAALNSDDSPDLVCELIDLFLKQTPGDIDKVRTAIDNNDHKTIMGEAHRMKSASANLGAKVMSALCLKLEEFGLAGISEGAGATLNALEGEFSKVKAELIAIDTQRKTKAAA